MMCALTDLSVLLYSQSPNREFLSGICNILCRSVQSYRNNNNKTVFAVSTCGEAAARTTWSSFTFHVLKEASHSNGSSEALRWLPPKGGWLCRPPPRHGGRASISAALEDTAVALLAGPTLAISKTSNPGATLWTVPENVCCQAPLSSQRGD